MRYDDRERHRHPGYHPGRPPHHDPHWPRRAAGGGGGGIPDGLLVGVLGFLLGLTIFVWTATGLAGLLTHGAWPDDVTFARTPLAVRELITEPHDIPGAWPSTPRGQLSGYGLFWGIFVSQLLVLMVLTIFVLGTIARARAVRKARRIRQEQAEEIPERKDAGSAGPAGHTGQPADASLAPAETAPRPAPAPTPPPSPAPAPAPAPEEQPPPPQEPAAPTSQSPSAAQPSPLAPTLPGTAATTGGATPTDGQDANGPTLGSGTAGSTAGDDDHDPVTQILEAPGAVLVSAATPDLWAATKTARAKLGPVHLFDPTHACDTPDRLRWSPHHGCADRTTAASRATALLAPLRSPRPIDATTHTTAETVLRCWLHAAALEKRPFREVHRWALATGQTADAVRILRTHPKATSGAAGELESALAGHPQLRADAVALIRRALAPLGQLHVRNACSAERADRLALESFIAEAGTLYVVGEDPDVLPILNALTQSVVEHGRRMAARSSDGRLDPPLTTILHLSAKP
ncbi:hypothetical protein ACQEU8_35065 [Streptomyces sp. CA-250714]|uniref:hypothetical protein n=1 Tax=Streptomyces sp. CA-250714 TaxID=3240060 RepID=UPI003D89DB22